MENRFSELVQEYGPSLHAFACRITRDEPVSEEIIQEVFLRLWQTRAAWSLNGNLENWLYRLTEKRVIHFLHKRDAEKKSRRYLRREPIGFESGPAAESEPHRFQPAPLLPESDASLRELLGETYASIRHHSATHVDADGRLVQAIDPQVLPHFLPRRRLVRDLRVAALATAAVAVMAFAAWLAWENQAPANAPEVHVEHIPAK